MNRGEVVRKTQRRVICEVRKESEKGGGHNTRLDKRISPGGGDIEGQGDKRVHDLFLGAGSRGGRWSVESDERRCVTWNTRGMQEESVRGQGGLTNTSYGPQGLL